MHCSNLLINIFYVNLLINANFCHNYHASPCNSTFSTYGQANHAYLLICYLKNCEVRRPEGTGLQVRICQEGF